MNRIFSMSEFNSHCTEIIYLRRYWLELKCYVAARNSRPLYERKEGGGIPLDLDRWRSGITVLRLVSATLDVSTVRAVVRSDGGGGSD